jgi:hypothetical protein
VPQQGFRDASLVPSGRLGAALGARRHRSRATLTATARRSEGRWNPADLRAIEVGDGELDDDAVPAICLLYGLSAGAPVLAADLAVVIDRTTTTDVLTPAGRPADPSALLERAVGICWSLGATPPMLSGLVDGLAACLTTSEVEIVEAMAAMPLEEVRAAAERLSGRTVVPAVGLLVGDTELGAIVVVRRRRRRRVAGTPDLPAAGPLSAFVGNAPLSPRPAAAASPR